MKKQSVLIVDDEKNIRLTLSQALLPLDLEVSTATDGEEALEKLATGHFGLVLLDIKMPGMDGIEVLRRLRQRQSGVQVVMITAHGTVENAVETMKLGAVDFIQKPFSVSNIRHLVQKVLAREQLRVEDADTYESWIELARRAITVQQFEVAKSYLQNALELNDVDPEAYNLLGVLYEIDGDRFEAQQHYRKALDRDPQYAPAKENLRQSVEPGAKGSFFLDAAKKKDMKQSPSG